MWVLRDFPEDGLKVGSQSPLDLLGTMVGSDFILDSCGWRGRKGLCSSPVFLRLGHMGQRGSTVERA